MNLSSKIPILVLFSLLFMGTYSCNSIDSLFENGSSKNDTIYCDTNSSYYLSIIKNESISKCHRWLRINNSEDTLELKGPIQNILKNILLTTKKQMECQFWGKETYFEIYYINKDDTTNVDREEILEVLLDKLDLTLKNTYDTVTVYELVVEDSSLLSKHHKKMNESKPNIINSKYYDFSGHGTTIENLASSLNEFFYDYFIITNIEDTSLYELKFRKQDDIKKIRKELKNKYGLVMIEKKAEIPFYIIKN